MKKVLALLISLLMVLLLLTPVFCAAEEDAPAVVVHTDLRKHIIRYTFTAEDGSTCP